MFDETKPFDVSQTNRRLLKDKIKLEIIQELQAENILGIASLCIVSKVKFRGIVNSTKSSCMWFEAIQAFLFQN